MVNNMKTNINNNINDDEDNSAGGIRSRFNDRLNKISKDKRIKNKEESTIKRGSRNLLKIFLALPSIVYSAVKSNTNSSDKINEKNNVVNDDISKRYNDLIVLTDEEKKEIRRIKVNKIKDINVSLMKKQLSNNEYNSYNSQKNRIKDTKNNHDIIIKETKIDENINEKKVVNVGINDRTITSKRGISVNNIENFEKNNEIELRITKLQKEIIDLIKKKLVKNINELEMLQSELYLLKELGMGDVHLKDCQEDIKEIKKLLSKVKSLKEKYDFLKENIDFEYMLEYGDDLLIDKILELKTLCSSSDIKYVVDNYKILDEYKYLYLKIDKLHDNTIKYHDYKNDKVEELKQRDIDFDKLKNEVYDVDKENIRYENFVKDQEKFLQELNNKVSQIESREDVTYRLKGFNQLLGNSFKYIGLLLLNPLKGFMPSIATQTLVTRNIIHNLYNNLEWEENRRMVYEAIDYSNSINNAINNLDLTSSMIDSTLDDITRLKNKYNREFAKYGSSISSYRDTIKKLNKIENAVLGSKIKIESMQIRMKEKEKENNNKLKMVKKLNTSSNS